MKNFVKLSKDEMKMVVGGYLYEGTCTITENGYQYACWCGLHNDLTWSYGLCRTIDNIA